MVKDIIEQTTLKAVLDWRERNWEGRKTRISIN
jgi:hypothetical protein